MRRGWAEAGVLLACAAAIIDVRIASGQMAGPVPQKAKAPMTREAVRYEPVPYGSLPNWATDDHAAAFAAFLKSCRRLVLVGRDNSAKIDLGAPHVSALIETCTVAMASERNIKSAADARRFFEQRFVAHRVVHAGPPGLLTAYYEPVIAGSRVAGGRFTTPIYRRPPDLVNLVEETQRGAVGSALTHARKTATGTEPYATRAEIDGGALQGRGLELLYLPDAVEVFFLQVQGSGRIRLPDGSLIRVTYDGKNGHPYTSIGRHLIDNGIIDAGRMSLQALAEWLKADPKRGRDVLWQNKSYVFFRELQGAEAASPLGVLDVPLTTGRSLAVDVGFHALGLPVFVSSPTLTHAGDRNGFRRLMVAQDVGSAIRGPERGDLFFGSGEEAAKIAGITKHPGTFHVLLPIATATAAKPDNTAAKPTGSIPAAPVKAPRVP